MGLASSGGLYVWGEFSGSTRGQFIDGLTTFLLRAGWELKNRVKATASGTFSSIVNGSTNSVGGLTYSFVTSVNNAIARQVKVGATVADSLANLVSAVNHTAGSGTVYSNATIVHPTVRAASSGATLTYTFKKAGPIGNGTASSAGVLKGGGFKVRGRSPQATYSDPDTQLASRVYVHDEQQSDFGSKYANIQMISETDSSVTSADRKIYVAPGARFCVIANRCQFFVYRPGLAAPSWDTALNVGGSNFGGGVPWVPSSSASCAGEVPAAPANDVFWASSDQHGELSLRSYLAGKTTGATGFWNATEGQFNGQVTTNFRPNSLTPSNDYFDDESGGARQNRPLIVGERTLLLEPLISWSPASSANPPAIYGQLYDAWYGTKSYPIDTVKQFDGAYWVAYSNTQFGTLWLKVPGPEPLQLADVNAGYAH